MGRFWSFGAFLLGFVLLGDACTYQCVSEQECLQRAPNFNYRGNKCLPGKICCVKRSENVYAIDRSLNATSTTKQPKKQDQQCGMRNANNQWKVTGNQATPAEFPWVVAVFYEGEYLVGGSLIAPGVVLTVADPLMDTSATKMVVRAAEWDMNSDREPFPYEERLVEKIVSHEDFHFTTGANNLALLFLKSKFQLKYQIATICLPSIESSFEEYGCIVAGWGRTKFTDRNNSAILKKINLPLVNTRTCEHRLKQTEELGWEYNLPKSLICAGAERNQDACIGDGGSALFCPIGGHNSNTYVQVGIVNWGIECGKENVPGTYTNVAMFAEWIKLKLLVFNYR